MLWFSLGSYLLILAIVIVTAYCWIAKNLSVTLELILWRHRYVHTMDQRFAFLCIAGAAALAWVVNHYWSGALATCISGALLPMLGIACLIWSRQAQRRFVSELIDMKFCVCPGCLYSLVDLSAVTQCPECGRPYACESLQSDWRQLIGAHRISSLGR